MFALRDENAKCSRTAIHPIEVRSAGSTLRGQLRPHFGRSGLIKIVSRAAIPMACNNGILLSG